MGIYFKDARRFVSSYHFIIIHCQSFVNLIIHFIGAKSALNCVSSAYLEILLFYTLTSLESICKVNINCIYQLYTLYTLYTSYNCINIII